MDKILVIGACGQLGSELTVALRNSFGSDNVIAADKQNEAPQINGGPFVKLDILDSQRVAEVIRKHNITQVYHLVALLSATAENSYQFAWKLNMDSLLSILEMAKEGLIRKVYWPSSIAAFGPNTPSINTPQHCVMDPNSVYGISKLAGERWCEYYNSKFNVDVRSLRYPGLIGYQSLPGGGTTDYAVDIYFKARAKEDYECFLDKGTFLPMMYMSDAVRATIELMEAKSEAVKIRSSYNINAMSFDPDMIYRSILSHVPEFKIRYKPDFRQEIADSWPQSIDDSAARSDWQWNHEYDLDKMTDEILRNI